MNKHLRTISLFFAIFFAVSGCQSTKSTQAGKSASWPKKMQGLSDELVNLAPFVYSRQEFRDPKNFKKIKKAMGSFASSIHDIPEKQGEKIVGKDPIVDLSLKRLREDVQLASKSFDRGDIRFSRDLLRGSINHCFRCHTRTNIGPEYINNRLDLSNFRIDASEKADLYVATRQYDKALEILNSDISSVVNFHDYPFEQERALKRYLAIMVRVKKDPGATIDTIDRFLRRENIPYYLAENARSWKQSLYDWVGEKKKKSKRSTYSEAMRLMKVAKKKQDFSSHEAANVEYLRATSLLHDSLAGLSEKKKRAEVYNLLGDSYSVLEDLGFWSLPEVYYEACVRDYPGTKLSKTCYKSFERSVVWGFSGSAGVFIPKEERKRLAELKGLAGL